MTRKDTILIAVVINAGLLAILFTTAVIYDTDKTIAPVEVAPTLVENIPPAQPAPIQEIAVVSPSSGDEVDNVLKYYAAPSSQPIVVETQPETYSPETIATPSPALAEDVPASKEVIEEKYIEVTVKKGDVLEKIARANKSSIAAIKKANQLQNENLSIGQVLKVPVKKKNSTQAIASANRDKTEVKTEPTSPQDQEGDREAVYHVVKSGDNPWKIAKQYHVKYDDILRLNHLNEEKARNLKIGDRIRVK